MDYVFQLRFDNVLLSDAPSSDAVCVDVINWFAKAFRSQYVPKHMHNRVNWCLDPEEILTASSRLAALKPKTRKQIHTKNSKTSSLTSILTYPHSTNLLLISSLGNRVMNTSNMSTTQLFNVAHSNHATATEGSSSQSMYNSIFSTQQHIDTLTTFQTT